MTEQDLAHSLDAEATAVERGLQSLRMGMQMLALKLRSAAMELRRLRNENTTLRARAVAAEHYKALDRLGRSSYREVVEDKLRTELAETQVRAEQAEAEVRRLREALRQIEQFQQPGGASTPELAGEAVVKLLLIAHDALAATRPPAAPESGCTAAAHPIKGATRPTEETSHE